MDVALRRIEAVGAVNDVMGCSVVSDIGGRSVPLSCEFFPARTPEGGERLLKIRQALRVLDYDYFSVTYGAGGSAKERTYELVAEILAENERPVMPHLTCVASKKSEIDALLSRYYALGIRQIMALRGDLPAGMYQAGELQNARELVRYIRLMWGEEAKILVAAYPEVHPRSKTPELDLRYFKEKVDAGANEAITQYFYNVDAYLRFRDEVVRLGVDIPIVAGIMPITNYRQLAKFSDGCGAEIPRWIRLRLQALQDDLGALFDFGADVVAKMCERLIEEEVAGLHFYSMNRADAMLAVAQRLRWIK